MKKIKNGFTLIELLVVMGIIAIMAALVTFNFNSARARARDVQRKNDMKAVQQALEIYKNDNGQTYPPSALWGDDSSGFMNTLISAKLISKSFSDPKESLKKGSWEQYKYSNDGNLTYTLTACLENLTDESAVRPLSQCATNAGAKYEVKQP